MEAILIKFYRGYVLKCEDKFAKKWMSGYLDAIMKIISKPYYDFSDIDERLIFKMYIDEEVALPYRLNILRGFERLADETQWKKGIEFYVGGLYCEFSNNEFYEIDTQ